MLNNLILISKSFIGSKRINCIVIVTLDCRVVNTENWRMFGPLEHNQELWFRLSDEVEHIFLKHEVAVKQPELERASASASAPVEITRHPTNSAVVLLKRIGDDSSRDICLNRNIMNTKCIVAIRIYLELFTFKYGFTVFRFGSCTNMNRWSTDEITHLIVYTAVVCGNAITNGIEMFSIDFS